MQSYTGLADLNSSVRCTVYDKEAGSNLPLTKYVYPVNQLAVYGCQLVDRKKDEL